MISQKNVAGNWIGLLYLSVQHVNNLCHVISYGHMMKWAIGSGLEVLYTACTYILGSVDNKHPTNVRHSDKYLKHLLTQAHAASWLAAVLSAYCYSAEPRHGLDPGSIFNLSIYVALWGLVFKFLVWSYTGEKKAPGLRCQAECNMPSSL